MFLGLVGSSRVVVVVVVVDAAVLSKDAVRLAGRKWVSEEKRIRFPSERRHPHIDNNTDTMPSSILLPTIFVFVLVVFVVVVFVFVMDRDGSG